MILAIRSGLGARQAAARASEVAKEHGEHFDFRYLLSDRVNWFFRPAHFIRESDGPGARKGKQLLLDLRRIYFRRYFQCVIVCGVGAVLGVLIAVAL